MKLISVFGADTLEKIKHLNTKSTAVICVVNRHYDFHPLDILKRKHGIKGEKNNAKIIIIPVLMPSFCITTSK